jgi:hypothetical protein
VELGASVYFQKRNNLSNIFFQWLQLEILISMYKSASPQNMSSSHRLVRFIEGLWWLAHIILVTAHGAALVSRRWCSISSFANASVTARLEIMSSLSDIG